MDDAPYPEDVMVQIKAQEDRQAAKIQENFANRTMSHKAEGVQALAHLKDCLPTKARDIQTSKASVKTYCASWAGEEGGTRLAVTSQARCTFALPVQ